MNHLGYLRLLLSRYISSNLAETCTLEKMKFTTNRNTFSSFLRLKWIFQSFTSEHKFSKYFAHVLWFKCTLFTSKIIFILCTSSIWIVFDSPNFCWRNCNIFSWLTLGFIGDWECYPKRYSGRYFALIGECSLFVIISLTMWLVLDYMTCYEWMVTC